jgi:hypothetical protein
MSRYVSVEKYVDIDVDMDDFGDDDILEEMERRGLGAAVASPGDNLELLQSIFQKRRTGQTFDSELDQLIYNSLGRIV